MLSLELQGSWTQHPRYLAFASLWIILGIWLDVDPITRKKGNMFYIIGVVVVVLFIAGFLGLR